MKTTIQSILTLLLALPLWVNAQVYDEVTNQKIRKEVRQVLEGYKSTIALLEDANTPSDERTEYVNALIDEYLANEQIFIYNDIDPGKTTGKSFQAKIYFENLILWYKEGFKYDLSVRNTQISDVLLNANRPYVKVNVTQTLRGNYTSRGQYNTASTRLTFYISFDVEERLSGGETIYLIGNTRISKIEEVSFVPKITLTRPVASAEIGKKVATDITWESNTISPLVIDLYRKGERIVNLTREGVSGAFSWVPAGDLRSGKGYRLNISTPDGSFSNQSPEFSLEEIKFIRLLYPTESDSLVKGDTYNLVWKTNVRNNIKIELLKGDSVVNVIAENVNATNQDWLVPTGEALKASGGYQIRISSGNVEGFSSDLVVTKERVKDFVSVVQPGVGTVLKRGKKAAIEWRHNMSGNFKIDLVKGANTRYTITPQTAEQASLPWKVKREFGTGDNYTVEVISLVNPNVKNRSNVFRIKKRSPLKWFVIMLLAGGGYFAYDFIQNSQTDPVLPEPPLPSQQ